MSKRLRSDEQYTFPKMLDIVGLGSMIVLFLELGQWSDWIWKSKNDVELLKKLLRLRPQIDIYTWNRAVDENDMVLLTLCHRPTNLVTVRNESKLIPDLVFGQEPMVCFLKEQVPCFVIKEAFYLCCANVVKDVSSLDWRLPLFMQSMTDKDMECGFLKACLASNVKAAKILWFSQRLKTHHFVFDELLMSTSLEMFSFLFELGIDVYDVMHMRVHFMNNPLILKNIRDTRAFELLQSAGIIQTKDFQHYFEIAFATNNVICMQYFYGFFAHFSGTVELQCDRGIWKSECVDIFLRHGELSEAETCKMIRQIRCDVFERAIDLVEHALGQIVTRQKTKAFLQQVTIAAWRAKNIPLMNWLHNVHSKATASSFAKCFNEYFHVVQSAPMCEFFIKHRQQTPFNIDQDVQLVQRAIKNRDHKMLGALIHLRVLTDDLIAERWHLQIALLDVCVSNIDFLRLIWQHTTYYRRHQMKLIDHAMDLENMDVFQFLTNEMQLMELKRFTVAKRLPFFCTHAMHILIAACKNDVRSLNENARLLLEYEAYSSLSNCETAPTFRSLWEILPISRVTLAKEKCYLFWKICKQNLDTALFLWQQQLVSSAELFAEPPFPNVTRQFLSAIHYDI